MRSHSGIAGVLLAVQGYILPYRVAQVCLVLGSVVLFFIKYSHQKPLKVRNPSLLPELLMGAKDYAEAAPILGDAHSILTRWGFGRYLEHQYHRILDKLDQSGVAKIRHRLGTILQNRGEYDADIS